MAPEGPLVGTTWVHQDTISGGRTTHHIYHLPISTTRLGLIRRKEDTFHDHPPIDRQHLLLGVSVQKRYVRGAASTEESGLEVEVMRDMRRMRSHQMMRAYHPYSLRRLIWVKMTLTMSSRTRRRA